MIDIKIWEGFKDVSNELVINVHEEGVSVALLEDKKLMEYHRESNTGNFSVGDIYIAKVKKLMPALNAAFVDVGYEKSAFIHYQDLGLYYQTIKSHVNDILNNGLRAASVENTEFEPILPKDGDIKDVIFPGQEILVQIAKEPISTKGPRLTGEISIAGRFLVLMPLSDKVFISQKIKANNEKKRIRKILSELKPKGYGVIVRTMGEGEDESSFKKELDYLINKWRKIEQMFERGHLPKCVHQEMDVVTGLLRDTFSPDYDVVAVNDEGVYNQALEYVKTIAPDRLSIVKLHDSDIPIFDYYEVSRQLKSSFGRMVSIKNGAYLVIEQTEAMMVIDVNSGNKGKSGLDQETNAFNVNMLAAEEIARQLRLRDIGGIIVIDFIDMSLAENKQELYNKIRECMSRDKAKHNILPLSKFCLMQITRHRVRPALQINIEEVCPTCHGTGKAQPAILIESEIEDKIKELKSDPSTSKFKLYVHPYFYSYLNEGIFFNSLKWKWKRKYGSFDVYADQWLGMLQYRIEVNGENKTVNIEDDCCE